MTFWEILTICLKYGPTLISAIARGADLIETLLALKKLDDAKQLAKEGKDTSGLEAVFNPPSKPSDPPAPGNH